MNKIITLTTTFLLALTIVKGQSLFPEKYDDCALTSFCLDCGDTKGYYSGDLNAFFSEKFQTKNFKNIEGTI